MKTYEEIILFLKEQKKHMTDTAIENMVIIASYIYNVERDKLYNDLSK